MRDRLTSAPHRRATPYGQGIDRVQNPWRAKTIPYLTIILSSVLPFVLMSDVMPILPPVGFMALIAWRLIRPGLLPLWIGVPLGAIDDLFSGQPFGSAILLWSIAMIALEIVENRFPWRGFWQDWFTAGLTLIIYIGLAMFVSGATLTVYLWQASLPQMVLAVLLYPLLTRIIAWFDLFRLARARRIG